MREKRCGGTPGVPGIVSYKYLPGLHPNYLPVACPGCPDCVCANCDGTGEVETVIRQPAYPTGDPRPCPVCKGAEDE